jgi:hypothetical protein
MPLHATRVKIGSKAAGATRPRSSPAIGEMPVP